jgi:hypothetical protein
VSSCPASPAWVYRRRHLITVGSVQPARSAICAQVNPSAASGTIRARSTTSRRALRPSASLQFRLVSIGHHRITHTIRHISGGWRARCWRPAGLRPGWRRTAVPHRFRRCSGRSAGQVVIGRGTRTTTRPPVHHFLTNLSPSCGFASLHPAFTWFAPVLHPQWLTSRVVCAGSDVRLGVGQLMARRTTRQRLVGRARSGAGGHDEC